MATVGNTAPSQNTVNYDALLSTTLNNYRAVMYDNIFKASAFLAALRKYNGIERINGGERIQRALMYETNTTVKSYQGYETIDVTPQDGMTSCFYEWREIAGTIAISRREERQNSGEAQMMDLLKQKTTQCEMSMKQAVNTQAILGTVSSATFVPGNNAKDLNPLAWFLRKAKSTDPTAGGNVGNISGSTYSWWRTRTASFGSNALTNGDFQLAVTTYKGLKVALYRLWNYCSRGADGSGPNLMVSDQITYETYENALDQDKRYMDDDLAQMGFDNIKLKGGTMVWDELVPDVYTGTAALSTGTIFMLNTKFYKLYVDSETDFVTTPFVTPENQTAKVAKVLFMGNTGVTNMRKHGLGCEISLSITA
jgi:hypothetical protein